MENKNGHDLVAKAKWVWLQTIKIHRNAPETRLASSLSAVEIYTALYYGNVVNIDAKNPRAEDRDRCIISKGHGSISMYPILADLGFFALDELDNVCKSGGFLGGIPDPVIPGYETINGSLGHGLGVGVGVALGLKTKQSAQSVFVVVGDGELHEGANWEAIMFARQHNLDNLNLIVDNNKISMLDFTDKIVSHVDLERRLSSFGFDCIRVDGHNVLDVHAALVTMKNTRNNRPKALIANTKKGHGVPNLEDMPLCHILNPKPELLDQILAGGEQ